jgi:ABC-2 type transport system ATP-binding protein
MVTSLEPDPQRDQAGTDEARERGIWVDGVVKRFRTVTALDHISLHVAPGEVVTLLGENGAGKSTLMRILATTIIPDAGRASVGGHDVVKGERRVRESIGLVLADERSLYWRLDAQRNLEFFAALYGFGRRRARQRAAELRELVGLAHAGRRMVATYSTGMRARLLIARSLIHEPDVLLFDEPTRSLDPVASAQVRELVVDLARERDIAALYATHDLHEAADIGSRAVVISQGRVVATAPTGVDAAHLESLFEGPRR